MFICVWFSVCSVKARVMTEKSVPHVEKIIFGNCYVILRKIDVKLDISVGCLVCVCVEFEKMVKMNDGKCHDLCN